MRMEIWKRNLEGLCSWRSDICIALRGKFEKAMSNSLTKKEEAFMFRSSCRRDLPIRFTSKPVCLVTPSLAWSVPSKLELLARINHLNGRTRDVRYIREGEMQRRGYREECSEWRQ